MTTGDIKLSEIAEDVQPEEETTDNGTSTQIIRIELYVDGTDKERKFGWEKIANAIQGHALMKNRFMTAWYNATATGMSAEEKKELTHLYSHTYDSSKGSAYADMDPKYFIKGLPTAGGIPFECKKLFSKACKDGLMYGKVSLPTFSMSNPLPYPNRFLYQPDGKQGLYHGYDSLEELRTALDEEANVDIGIHFFEGIELKIKLGSNIYRSQAVRNTLYQCFSGEKTICDSSLQLKSGRNKGRKLFLNLAFQTEKVTHELDENVTVGVHLGFMHPLTLALNINQYQREFVGSFDKFAKQRIQFQEERRRLQKELKYSNGGHGRGKKLKKLEDLKEKERNWVKTQNHIFSKEVIKYALKNNAKYINMESLDIRTKGGVDDKEEDNKTKYYLRNWSYYELQQMIQYKAEREGMVVRFINPAYTSQTCSVCGEIGARPTKMRFHCNTPKCACKKMYKGWQEKNNEVGLASSDENYAHMDADFNAARNIAMTEEFVDNSKKGKAERRIAFAKEQKEKRQKKEA